MAPRGNLLLVDDSPLLLEVTGRALERAGFAVRMARDLEEVERARASGPLDLILMDVEMAEAFGDDIALLLRGEGDQVPIYLLSALPEAELAERAAGAGINGYISKRAGAAGVVRRVSAALGGPAPRPLSDLRGEFAASFGATVRRRVRHARAALAQGGPDAPRRVAFELHALVGEASILGFADIADRAQHGRTRAESGTSRDAELAADIDAIEQQVAGLPSATPAPGLLQHGPGGGELIMLVDDSELYRATMRAILEEAGYAVAEAGSLAECRALLPDTDCAMAVLDVELGDGNGTSLIADVRRTRPHAAVVIMSGGEGPTLPAGADLVLLKTLDPTTVLAKLDRLLAHRRA